MRAVFLPVANNDLEQAKDRDPQTGVTGSTVYASAVLKALLEFGSYDRYYVMVGPEQGCLATADGRRRVNLISTDNLPRFSHSDEVIFFAAQPALHILSPWRRSLGVMAAPLSGIIHSMHTRLFFMLLMRLLLTGDLHSYDALICSSRAGKIVVEKGLARIALQFKQMYGSSAEFQPQLPVIPLGVRVSDFQFRNRDALRANCGFTNDAVVFLYLGRFSAMDKADLAPMIIAFCRNVAPRCPAARLVLAGDDTAHKLTPSLQGLAAGLNSADRILIRANVSREHKSELLAAADVFVSPSDNIQETFGITLIEAMAAGLPVLASDWDGYKDIVVHGRTGFLIPTYMYPMDSSKPTSLASLYPLAPFLAAKTVVDVESWTQYALDLALHPDLRRSMGAEARLQAEKTYDWSVVIRGYEELWSELSARAGVAKSSPLSVGNFSFDEMTFESIFDHYPTAYLGGQALQASPGAAALLQKPEVVAHLLQPARVFENRVFAAVLSAIEILKTAAADELVSRIVREQALPAAQVHLHLARMMKFGLISLVDDCRREDLTNSELAPIRGVAAAQ